MYHENVLNPCQCLQGFGPFSINDTKLNEEIILPKNEETILAGGMIFCSLRFNLNYNVVKIQGKEIGKFILCFQI